MGGASSMEQDRKAWKFQAQRLPQRDYGASGAYFVTIRTYQRQPCLKLPALEEILKQQWHELPQRFPGISLDQFVVMPDHVHFIVWINAHIPSSPTLPQIVGAYKSLCAVAWLRHLKEAGSEESGRIWQRGYNDRIIRDKEELERTRRYVQNNPIVG
jgi:REP element-mobilizing transposase RayT